MAETTTGGIQLMADAINQMTLNGELGWFLEDSGAGGYEWTPIPDGSGVYELAETIVLAANVPGASGGGMMIWKIKAVKEGRGSIKFELKRSWEKKQPIETKIVHIEVIS